MSSAQIAAGEDGSQVHVAATRNFAIDAQPLGAALARFGRQSGLQVVFASETLRGLRSNPVSGNMTPTEALTRLTDGTGLSWRISRGAVVVEVKEPHGSFSLSAGEEDSDAIVLETIIVDSGPEGEGFDEDTAYHTPGSVSHIAREQMDRVPATSPGDVFLNTPGVIAAGNRVGTSVNPNIRGLQGMGRVKVTVDGSEQTTSSYRGYIGNRDETYIDPDMIGGIDITKGPGGTTGGGIGGSVVVRTLEPEDIMPEGQSSGVRIKAGLGSNSSSAPETGTATRADGGGLHDGDSFSGSVAAAAVTERFDLIAAYSRRTQGNYFAGDHAPSYFRFPGDANPNSIVPPGQEVFNTSEDTRSVLLKGRVNWGDGHSLQLGYLLYDSDHGEILELMYAPWYGDLQRPLSQTTVDTYTAKYRWTPAAHAWINLRANLWMSDLDRVNGSFAPEGASIGYGNSAVRTWGGDLSNSADVATDFGSIVIDMGLNIAREDATAEQWRFNDIRWETAGPSGIRTTYGAHANVTAKIANWIELTGGLRYDYYRSRGKGYLAEYPDRSESKVSPNAGITLTPWQGVQLFALYKEGFRAPSLRETHWNYQDLLINNPSLAGEKARDAELGINVMRDGVFAAEDSLRIKAAYFHNRYDDYIVRKSASATSTYPYQWDNIDRATYGGIEISGAYDRGAWFVEAAVTRYNSIEYCDEGACGAPGSAGALGRDYTANYIPPKYFGTLTVAARVFDRKLTLGARAQFADVRFGSDWDEVSSLPGQVGTNFTWPSYDVYDVFGSYAFSEETVLNFSVENITDKYYYGALASGGIPGPGRTARVSLTMKF